MKNLMALAVVMALTGCKYFDTYEEKFGRVEIGDSRARVVEVMGAPDTANSIEVPLVTAEQLTWKSRASARVYTVRLVWGLVATKSVTQ